MFIDSLDSINLIAVATNSENTRVIRDTIWVGVAEKWWQNPALFSALASALSASLALWTYLRSRVIEFNSKLADINVHIHALWETANNSYDIWKSEIHIKELKNEGKAFPPDNLRALVLSAGPPPNDPNRASFKNYFNELEAVCDQEQKWLFAFVERLYPRDKNTRSILTTQDEKRKFTELRAVLAHTFNNWAETFYKRRLVKRINHHLDLLIFLSWLEITLARSLDSTKPAKQNLFRLTNITWESELNNKHN